MERGKARSDVLKELLEVEDEIERISTGKELTAPANFDYMFKIGVYGPLIASLHFQLFLAFFHVLFYIFYNSSTQPLPNRN